jgi:glycosyltransferase involved in cell wall biosynthesis
MAIQQVRAKGINAYLNLQGTADETYKNQILAYMADHQLEPYINFLPYNPDPHKAVREADIALVCSRLEAFGRVTVEAMKLGIPVVATATAGSLEIIGKDQTRGLLYNPGDVAALTDCILQYHQSPELRLSLATTAYDWAWQHCNLETHAQQIDAILQNVAHN